MPLFSGSVIGETQHELLLGYWICQKGHCMDPEIYFGIEEKKHIYSSWLHARPAATGTWSVEGNRLSIECCSGFKSEWEIIRVDQRVLVLRHEISRETGEYSRIEE